MAHFYTDIHEARIREALERVKHLAVLERVPLSAECAVTPEPVPFSGRLALEYRPVKRGDAWGGTWDCAWFRITGAIPRSWKGAHVTLNLDFGGETLVFDPSGAPLCGLTNGSVFAPGYAKDHLHYIERAEGGEKIELWADAGCNGLFGVKRPSDPDWEEDPEKKAGWYRASVDALDACRFDVCAWQLWNDLRVLTSLIETLPQGSARRTRTVRAVSEALDFLPEPRGGAKAVREALARTVFAVAPDPSSMRVTAVGHAHIDTAWLWPFRETVRKVGRTWASQISLLKRYPGYKFGASQAQLYEYCKTAYPALYAEVREAVARGDWEVQGGMWVEADCNIPCGESLVRQFAEGMRFFEREFGAAPRNLWLPDVFGYSGNLPQIMKICGVDSLLTQKLSWNRYNKFPHNTFVWEGIDGSRVLAHFPPEDTYDSTLLPASLARNETNNPDAGIVDEALSLFGVGDGGGGPAEEHIENGLRARALNGCPRVEFGFAQPALDRMAALADRLDTWTGELYFEMHRGTYTTQARQKLLNRRAEEAMRVAEALSAAAGAEGASAAETSALWRDVLLCQFHDIIPGSSIARVYRESAEILERAIAKARAIAEKAAAALLSPDASAVTLFNPSSTPYEGTLTLPEGWKGATAADGAALPAQEAADGAVKVRASVPPASFATFRRADAAPARVAARAAENGAVLENALVRYEFDGALRLVSATDKETGAEFVRREAPGNALETFDDHPARWDAWDVEEYASRMQCDAPREVSLALEEGPVESALAAEFRIGSSVFRQRITLAAGSKRLDFATEADWNETHRILRVSFPVAVRAENASFEIQYGVIRRPVHDNTKWDHARFETCAQRFADLSNADRGVALLNDCKYGCTVKGSVMSLSLLRSPTNPDPYADKGRHRFTYAILPHKGPLEGSDEVFAAAAALNQGVARFDGFAAGERAVLPVAFEGEGVELAVLKKADSGEGLAVRLAERRGREARGTLRVLRPGAKIVPCLATELSDTGPAEPAPAVMSFRPFEIKTFRVEWR